MFFHALDYESSRSCFIFRVIIILFLILRYYLRFCIIYIGPGYLPFYANDNELMYTHDTPSGILISKEQLEYANTHPLKTDALLIISTGRYVIGADQYNRFLASWIGKNNRKLYIHYLIIDSLLMFTYFIILSRYFYPSISSGGIDFIFATLLLILIVCFVRIGQNLFSFFDQIRHIIQGTTSIREYFHQYSDPDSSFLSKTEDFCGPKRSLWKWFLPIPATFPSPGSRSINV